MSFFSRCPSAVAPLLAGLLISGAAYRGDQGTEARDAAARSVLDYATWAEQVLAAPPAGIRLLPRLEDRLAERMDEARAEQDLTMLRRDPGLQRAARTHAVDMLQHDYTGHVGPAGRSVAERVGILERRFIGLTGENLAETVGIPGDAVAAQVGPMAVKLVSGFLDSPEHRKNLLNPDYTHRGIGAAVKGDRLIVVHVFGDRRALLKQDLPLQVRRGAKLPLAFERGAGLSTPVKYGFALPSEPTREIVPLDVALAEVAVGPGSYQLQFFLPTEQSNRFLVVPGPILVVR